MTTRPDAALLAGARLVAVDTETTGFNPKGGDELIEVACVAIVDGQLGEAWSSLVRPRRPIPAGATAIHHITDAMVAGAPEPALVAAELRRRCDGAMLVCHNASFDVPFLNALQRAGGVEPLANPVIDTLGLARDLRPGEDNSMGRLARDFQIRIASAHRAGDDARATAELFMRLLPLWQSKHHPGSLAELAADSQDVVRLTRRDREWGRGRPERADRAPEAPGPLL